MAYDNTNRGSIWKNDDKQSDKHPDFKGSFNVEGKDYWVSAWKRAPGANPAAPALTFSVKAKDEQKSQQAQQTAAQSVPQDDFKDDDIPF